MELAGLLNGSNLTYDYQNTLLAKALINGYVSGLAVTTNSVASGEALIKCTRTSGQVVFVSYHNTAAVSIDTTGTKKVWIAVNQSNLDDGTSNSVDGTGIASIQTGANYPSGNYVPLASIASGVITDARPLNIKQNILGNPIASASNIDLSQATGNTVHITGTTAITSLGTLPSGIQMTLIFDGILTLTHNSTSLILPSSANIITQVGDTAEFISEGNGNWRCFGYQRKDGTALISNASWFRAGNGSDGALNISSGTTTLSFSEGVVVKNYSSITISGSALLAFSGKTANGGIAILNCQGDFNMTGGTVNISSQGADGGAGTANANASGNVGKNGLSVTGLTPVNGGSCGNYASDSAAVVGFKTPVSYESGWACGSGGGSGGTVNSGTGATGAGGIGGGCLIINVGGNVNFSGGTINANGGNGGNSTFSANGGGGGGGGGGRVLIICGGNIVSQAGTVTVAGGSGGSPSGAQGNSGGGGGGIGSSGQASWSRTSGVGQAGTSGVSSIVKFINS